MTALSPTSLKIDGAEVASMPLPESITIEGIDGRPLQTRDAILYKSEDGVIESGVWEIDAGRYHARFAQYGETIRIVTGELICTSDEDGRVTRFVPGDTALFPRGWSGTWEMPTGLRKVYTTYTAQ